MIQTAPAKKETYAYSVAMIRTLEVMLLKENEIERMILAKNAHEAFKILNESDYANNIQETENPSEFQQIINEGLLEIKEKMDKSCPDKNILNILWFYYDFHNIKTLIKAKLGNIPAEKIQPILSDMGKIKKETLQKFILNNEDCSFHLENNIEKFIKTKIRKVQKLFQKENNNPQIIDLYLDQKLISLIYKTAKHSQNEFLIKYVKILIDLNNIRLFFRMKSQNKEKHLFEIALLWKGTISKNKFKQAYDRTLGEFIETMSKTDYAKVIEEGYRHYEKENNFMELEKNIENYLTNYIKKAKYIPFGPEPLIAYYLAKQNNALIIRMILINKLNNINPENIKTKLRDLYI